MLDPSTMADLAPAAGSPFSATAPATLRMRLGALRLRVRAGLGRGVLPNALVIGAAKGGTTSVHRWLSSHPEICGAQEKEVRYFNQNREKGPAWYAARFAPRRGERIRIEASPSYMWDPLVPLRVKSLLGAPKLIVLLREPVDRAWSHYWMSVRLGLHTISFAEALAREALWFGPAGAFPADGSVASAFYMHHSFLGKGVYAPQIQRWLSVFPRRCFHFIRSEDLFRAPGATLSQLLRFLDLPQLEMGDLRAHNAGHYPPLDPGLRHQLEPHFAESNARVEALTGIRWSASPPAPWSTPRP